MDVQNGKVQKGASYLVVVMRFYPRFLKKELVDEYVRALAPGAELFSEFKALDRKLANHGAAFYSVGYENRFDLTEEGRQRLAEFSEMGRERDVVLICQCRDYDRCHCDLLLLWAQHRHQADIKGMIFDYPDFKARLASGELL